MLEENKAINADTTADTLIVDVIKCLYDKDIIGKIIFVIETKKANYFIAMRCRKFLKLKINYPTVPYPPGTVFQALRLQ